MQIVSQVMMQWFVALLFLATNAAAGLPVLIGIGLCAGRRGNAPCYLWAARKLYKFALLLAAPGAFYFPLAYWVQVLPYQNDFLTAWRPFLQLTGLPWSSGLVCWLAGMFCVFLSKNLLPVIPGQTYKLAQIKASLFAAICAAIFYFATYFLVNWPFAGLPAALDFDQAAMAIARNAASHYFMAFGIAGGAGLLWVYADADECSSLVKRWLGAWGCLGYLPHVLRGWSIFLGMAVSGKSFGFGPNYTAAAIALCCASLASVAWAMIALKFARVRYLTLIGFGFLLVEISMPFIYTLFKNM